MTNQTLPAELIQRVSDMIPGCSEDDLQIEMIGAGATSAAWRVTGKDQTFIVRTMLPTTNRPVTYRSEFRLLRELHTRSLPVPEAISNSFEHPASNESGLPAWAITRPVVGSPILNEPMPPRVALQLGQVLAMLHRLPCEGYGRLDEANDAGAVIRGLQTTPLEGIRARWCWATIYPFDGSQLSDHPITTLAPHLITPLTGLEPLLGQIGGDEHAVITHSDLYGEHIFLNNKDLTGLIDFGAAFIGVPGWEFAVLAYYHGWQTVETVLEGYYIGYDVTESRQRQLLRQSLTLAVVVSLYKLQKAFKSNQSTPKIDRIVQFVDETLRLLELT
ncbi:MAG TPA: aminoglycoside phosphotransferase family protein [Phototrophicaceae bacterium]|jgi:aminoglycoside phosphotransferase (APT) family kinase protein|nr:aminoglycoside phosphotransferase family protein [Phototrophicaceae bacterium]